MTSWPKPLETFQSLKTVSGKRSDGTRALRLSLETKILFDSKFFVEVQTLSRTPIEDPILNQQPHLSKRSRLLAQKKEEKEKREILRELGVSEFGVDFDSMKSKFTVEELLFARAKFAEKRKMKLADELILKELSECTFHPDISGSKPLSHAQDGKKTIPVKPYLDACVGNATHDVQQQSGRIGNGPVHERLYALRERQSPVKSKFRSTAQEELERCAAASFSPSISSPPMKRNKANIAIKSARTESSNNIPPPPAPGFTKTVERLRKANAERQKYKDDSERDREELETKYLRSRKLSSTGFKPFHFMSEERAKRAEEKKNLNLPPR